MSPYGVDKKLGGDSPENDSWMERCVEKVMKTGREKGSAIAICKTTMRKMRGNKDKAELHIDRIYSKLTV